MNVRTPRLRQIIAALALALALTFLSSPLPAASAAVASSTAVVTHGGNLRSEPRIAPRTVVGQVCPGDHVTVTRTSVIRHVTWYYGTITSVVADCAPTHVAVGTVGWLRPTLVRMDSARPTPTARPASTPAPAPPATAGVVITQEPGAVSRGATASVGARTAPRQRCSITVRYKSGRSTAAGLVPKAANDTGNVAWRWKVGTRTTPGSWPVTITCGHTSATTSVRVR